jgi:hypothetical protein
LKFIGLTSPKMCNCIPPCVVIFCNCGYLEQEEHFRCRMCGNGYCNACYNFIFADEKGDIPLNFRDNDFRNINKGKGKICEECFNETDNQILDIDDDIELEDDNSF